MLLLKDREYLPALLQAIRKAKKEIRARVFVIDPGRERRDPALQILEALAAAKRRGVSVQILTDNIFRFKPLGKRLLQAVERRRLAVEWDLKETVLH